MLHSERSLVKLIFHLYLLLHCYCTSRLFFQNFSVSTQSFRKYCHFSKFDVFPCIFSGNAGERNFFIRSTGFFFDACREDQSRLVIVGDSHHKRSGFGLLLVILSEGFHFHNFLLLVDDF